MADMILTPCLLDLKYIFWFHNKNTEQAKSEILRLLSQNPKQLHKWSKLYIRKHFRKIVAC